MIMPEQTLEPRRVSVYVRIDDLCDVIKQSLVPWATVRTYRRVVEILDRRHEASVLLIVRERVAVNGDIGSLGTIATKIRLPVVLYCHPAALRRDRLWEQCDGVAWWGSEAKKMRWVVYAALNGVFAFEKSRSLLNEITDHPSDDYILSGRELDVMYYLIQHLSNKEIAATLEISLPLVKKRLRSIYAKLGARSRSEAILSWLGWREGGPADLTHISPALSSRTCPVPR